MADSWLKKERTKKKQQEKQQKAERRLERKEQARNGNKLETMLAYVDENGNITSQPPQLHKRVEINAEDIEIGVPKHEPDLMTQTRKGIVSFFNQTKGFGFIRDIKSGESIFVHEASLTQPIKENNRVSFEAEKGPKGLNAVNVKLA